MDPAINVLIRFDVPSYIFFNIIFIEKDSILKMINRATVLNIKYIVIESPIIHFIKYSDVPYIYTPKKDSKLDFFSD